MCGGGGGDGPGAPLWIVSFSDMIANLVTFFIVMTTFNAANSKGDQIKRFNVESEPGVFGGQNSKPKPDVVQKRSDRTSRFGVNGPVNPSARRELATDKFLDKFVQSAEYNVKPGVVKTEDGVRITLQQDGLFPAGSTEIKPIGKILIEEAGNHFRGEEGQILIEAHVDDTFWQGAGARSAEEFTRAMAISVARLLVKQCEFAPARVAIQPFGASQPIAPNDTALGRSRNRRIVLIFGRDP